MKFQKTKLPGVQLVTAEPFVDARGTFRRQFCADEFKHNGVPFPVNQVSVSENPHLHTLRGFHYQIPPHQEGKLVSCLHGKIFDAIVDLRPDSSTYLQWEYFELNDHNRSALYIPEGIGHGFLTLVPNTIVIYYMTHPYVAAANRGVRFNDPLFKIAWPYQPQYISDKDRSFPNFDPKNPLQ